MAKNILIMESDLQGKRGNRSSGIPEMYRELAKGHNYKVCVFGKSSKGVPKERCLARAELYHTRFDAIILNSLKDVMFVKTYRLFNRNGSTRYIYVDKEGVLQELMTAKLRKLLPGMLVRWNLFLNMSAWLDYYIATSEEQKRFAAEHFDGMGTKIHIAAGSGRSSLSSSRLAAECRHIIDRG